jgi:hypothetical protein
VLKSPRASSSSIWQRAKRNLFGTYAPADPTGLAPLSAPNYSRDLKSYVYNYSRITSDLYIVDGLK